MTVAVKKWREVDEFLEIVGLNLREVGIMRGYKDLMGETNWWGGELIEGGEIRGERLWVERGDTISQNFFWEISERKKRFVRGIVNLNWQMVMKQNIMKLENMEEDLSK
jgi:hypothetical protein